MPFSLNIGSLDFNIVIDYLKYAFAPKDSNDPNFIGNAYLFGSNIGIDNLLKIGGQNLKKSILVEIGSYHSGIGVCVGFNMDYRFNRIPFFFHTYGKLYGLPSDEIFTSWFSLGLGAGIDLDNIFSSLNSDKKD